MLFHPSPLQSGLHNEIILGASSGILQALAIQ